MDIEIQKGKTRQADQQEYERKSPFLVTVFYKTLIIQKAVKQQHCNTESIKECKACQKLHHGTDY
jgi:hypothetical protein